MKSTLTAARRGDMSTPPCPGGGVRSAAEGRRAQEEGGDPGRDAARPGRGQRPAAGRAGHTLHDGTADEADEDRDHR